MALNITTEEIKKLVAGASWYFQISPDPREPGNHAFIADGVDDIDFVSDQLVKHPQAVLEVDVGLFGGSFKRIGQADLDALRAAFVARWGEVNKGTEFPPT